MKIKPLFDRVLLRRIEPETEVKRGIVIPDTAREKPQEAEVVAVGPGKLSDQGDRLPMSVSKGARVLIGKYSGTEVNIGEEELTIVREEEILAVIAEPKKRKQR